MSALAVIVFFDRRSILVGNRHRWLVDGFRPNASWIPLVHLQTVSSILLAPLEDSRNPASMSAARSSSADPSDGDDTAASPGDGKRGSPPDGPTGYSPDKTRRRPVLNNTDSSPLNLDVSIVSDDVSADGTIDVAASTRLDADSADAALATATASGVDNAAGAVTAATANDPPAAAASASADDACLGFFGIIDDGHPSTMPLLKQWLSTFEDIRTAANHKDAPIVKDQICKFAATSSIRLYSVLCFVANGGTWRSGLSLANINDANNTSSKPPESAVSTSAAAIDAGVAANDVPLPLSQYYSYEQSFDGGRTEGSSDTGWEDLPPILSGVSIGLNRERNYYDAETKSRIISELSQKLSTGLKWHSSPPAPKRITGDGDDYLLFYSQIIRCNSYNHPLCKGKKRCHWKIRLQTRSDRPGKQIHVTGNTLFRSLLVALTKSSSILHRLMFIITSRIYKGPNLWETLLRSIY